MRKYLFILVPLMVASVSCRKSKDKPLNGGSTPVQFTTTEYAPLGTFDDSGRPNYLVASDVISSGLTNFVNASLPERGDVRNLHPEYLKNADLAVTAKSDVYITFAGEGTGYTNTVGFYVYKTGESPKKPADIQKITYIFPHAQKNDGGTLKLGDKVKLGTFEAGTSIGFVLLEKGWDMTTKTINKNAPHYCSNKELNPENREDLKAHTVLFDYPAENKVIIGFEDINRTLNECDHDFNDVVMYATVTKL